MPLVPLRLPPGIYRNGTEYQAQGRWYDASLVRWTDGTMRPIGGWETRVTMGSQIPRAAVTWRALNGERWLSVASYGKLIVASSSGTVTDITPVALVPGAINTYNQGFGGGTFGTAAFGTSRPDSGVYTEVTTWSLDNWGETLVGCSNYDGKIYEWGLNVANKATAITGAPTGNLGIVVTEERFLVALGAGGNPRLVQWSGRENNTVWTPLSTNEAGDLELQTSGQIMQAVRTIGQTLILTDRDAHTMKYIGPPYVYGLERVGQSCGAVSRKTAVSVDGGVYWMGVSGFFRFAGGSVQEVPSEVADYVFSGLNTAQASKAWGVSNSKYGEIWWFYPSTSSTEVDRYVVYNYQENHWAIGSMVRTAGVDAGVFANPIWWGVDAIAYNHERGLSYGGAEVYAQSGPIEAGGGETVMSAVELIPDDATQGDVTLTFGARFNPNDVVRSYGPYSLANPTSLRFTGRQVTMRVTGARLADWRFGIPRLDVRQGGGR